MPTTTDLTPAEVKRVMEMRRAGNSFLLWRAAGSSLSVLDLTPRDAVTVGRRSANDLALGDDPQASRLHACLERFGEDWLVLDDGISRNGTFINGERVRRRQRLFDGDQIRFGSTFVIFHRPADGASADTAASGMTRTKLLLTPTQRRILVALCRPLREGHALGTPATNAEIASEVYLGLDAVKAHLRELYKRFGIGELPQNRKRGQLARLGLQLGLVNDGDEPERRGDRRARQPDDEMTSV